jgi:hypothetical protein
MLFAAWKDIPEPEVPDRSSELSWTTGMHRPNAHKTYWGGTGSSYLRYDPALPEACCCPIRK